MVAEIYSMDSEEEQPCGHNNCKSNALNRTNFCLIHTTWEKITKKKSPEGKNVCALVKCINLAQRKSQLCKTHNRFKKCKVTTCVKRALRYDDLCGMHGGGKRCTIPHCNNIIRSRGLCIGHGGGRRCQLPNCPNSAIGSTGVCKAHGAGKRFRAMPPRQNIKEKLSDDEAQTKKKRRVSVESDESGNFGFKKLLIMDKLRIISEQRRMLETAQKELDTKDKQKNLDVS